MNIAERYDVVVVGGGMSGLCAAIASARGGAKTVMIHARPMLGGNAGSEIRMHICGADDHMSRPNARETGILEELLLTHKHRNPTNSYPIFDTILWEAAAFTENLTLRLNTCVDGVSKRGDFIASVSCYQQTTEKRFCIEGSYFIDATGDGFVGAAAGADYTVGRESKNTYGESFAPEVADHYTMGNSLMFRTRDAGRPVPFVCPPWANRYTEEDLKNRIHDDVTSGYWWIELGGGRYDTTADYETIRDELLKAVYGVWDHIKNAGDHGAQNLDLEWVGFLPGKRESRRFLGDYTLCQQDCEGGRRFDDAVAYGGWPMDVHAVEGFLNSEADPTVWIHLKDVYTIPYRCFYSRNVENLFFCGRIISASHMAFASARVMATCAVGGQAAGTAAAMAAKKKVTPRQMGGFITELQQRLLKDDCYIPGLCNLDDEDMARTASVWASHTLEGYRPEDVVNGVARTVCDAASCWAANATDAPALKLSLPGERTVSEIRLTFDSNLSREITISINDQVLARQVMGPPPELMQSLLITVKRRGGTVKTISLSGLYHRHVIVKLPESFVCDEVVLSDFVTHGSGIVKVFEIRLY